MLQRPLPVVIVRRHLLHRAVLRPPRVTVVRKKVQVSKRHTTEGIRAVMGILYILFDASREQNTVHLKSRTDIGLMVRAIIMAQVFEIFRWINLQQKNVAIELFFLILSCLYCSIFDSPSEVVVTGRCSVSCADGSIE